MSIQTRDQPMIQFENVSKKYQLGLTRTSLPTVISRRLRGLYAQDQEELRQAKCFWALRDVNLKLEKGSSLALIGPNGAGKTTVLKLLANITKPTSGIVTTKGKLSALIELGAGFHPDLSGRENIFLNGTIMGLRKKEIERRFDDIVDFSGLERFVDTPVKRYSSGMTVRLGFAVAACIDPDILLVDEVLAVGDATFSEKCLSRIRALINNGTTIIFVSHNLYMVQSVCRHSAYLSNGQIRQLGDTREVIETYERDLQLQRTRRYKDGGRAEQIDIETDLEITKVEIDSEYRTGDELLSSRPAHISVHYNLYRDIGRVNMSLFIVRSDGLTCCMMRTQLKNFLLDLKSGKGLISVQLNPLQLISGTYFVEAWFLNESDSMAISDKPSRSDWFSVKGSTRSYEQSSGVYEPLASWSHVTDAAVVKHG